MIVPLIIGLIGILVLNHVIREYKVKHVQKILLNLEEKIVLDLYRKKKYVIHKRVQLIVLLIIGLIGELVQNHVIREYTLGRVQKILPNLGEKIVLDHYPKKKNVIHKMSQLIVLYLHGLLWGICSSQCGGGNKTKSRTTNQSKYGGKPVFRILPKKKNVIHKYCPINCTVSPWSSWSNCPVSCGGGTQKKSRSITKSAQFGGVCPESLSEEEKCNTQNCPINCTVSPWSSWSKCPVSCNGGSQTKTRTITKGAQFGGVCPESLSEEEKCNTQNCPINCTVSPWSSWSNCPVSCGGGTQKKSRSITKNAQFGGVFQNLYPKKKNVIHKIVP